MKRQKTTLQGATGEEWPNVAFHKAIIIFYQIYACAVASLDPIFQATKTVTAGVEGVEQLDLGIFEP